MGERTGYENGAFNWVELGTDAPESARDFYSALFGWEAEDVEGEHGVTHLCRMGGRLVSTIMPRGAKQPVNAWNSYLAVDDVDAVTDRAAELGATVAAGPFSLRDLGRLAFILDPTGAAVGLWQAGEHFGAELVNDPGSLVLNELSTSDPQAAMEFFGELFGWRFEQASPEPDPYWLTFRGTDETSLNAGIRRLDDDAAYPPSWLVYFSVKSVDESVAEIRELGGSVELEPMELDAGGRIAVVLDPQGAAFGLFEGNVDP